MQMRSGESDHLSPTQALSPQEARMKRIALLLVTIFLCSATFLFALGTHDRSKPDDYPDYAASVAEEVVSGRCERGLLICGSGVGVSVAANKFPGIRAAMCHDHYSAHQAVEHDDMNVLCIGARVIGEALARELVRAFADACFSGEDRHVRRRA